MSAKVALVNSCINSVAASGLDGIATSRIARDAGVATGTLFHHFPDKAALLSYSYLSICQSLAGSLQFYIDTENRNRSAHIWNALMKYWLTNPEGASFYRQLKYSAYYTEELVQLESEIFDSLLSVVSDPLYASLKYFNFRLLINISMDLSSWLAEIKPGEEDTLRAISYGYSLSRDLFESQV